jgi:hypothetical protein
VAFEERKIARWARSRVPAVTPVEIERRVLLENPRARRPSPLERFRSGLVWFLVRLVIFVSPIGGAGAVIASSEIGWGRSDLDPDLLVPVSGACFVVANLLVVLIFAEWWAYGRPRSAGYLATCAMVAVSAGVTLTFVQEAGSDADGWARWMVPTWVALVLACALLLAVLVGSRSDAPGKPAPVPPLDVATLDAAERDELLQIRQQTLRTLADRGLIDESVPDRARDVPLGELPTIDTEPTTGRQRR